MKNDTAQEEKKISSYWKKQILLFFLLCLLGIALYEEVTYEIRYEKTLTSRIMEDSKQVELLKEEIEVCQNEIQMLTQQYVQEISAKPCIILCFDQFGKSCYNEIIETMDACGYKGVIVFRDGQAPGEKGSISVELYQQLLDKGWEGAIGSSEDITLYNNLPQQVKNKWTAYMQEMKLSFETAGLAFPTVYIPNVSDDTQELEELLEPFGMNAYTTLADSFQTIAETATEMNTENWLNITLIKGKYNYNTLAEDILITTPKAQSFALWFRRIEGSLPGDTRNTSIYRFNTQIETLESYGENVNVTTFSGYRQYQESLVENNKEYYQDIEEQKEELQKQIELNQELIKKYYRE